MFDCCAQLMGAGGQPDMLFTSAALGSAEMQRREALPVAVPGVGDPFGGLWLRTVVLPAVACTDLILADPDRIYAEWGKDATIEMSERAA